MVDEMVARRTNGKKNRQDIPSQPPMEQQKIPQQFFDSVVIEGVSPEIDGGLFAVKSVVGDRIVVQADIFKDGHDILGAAVLYREASASAWQSSSMHFVDNDRWEGSFQPKKNARYLYTVSAWVDLIKTWLDHVEKKARNQLSVSSDVAEGLDFLERLKSELSAEEQKALEVWLQRIRASEGASEEMLRIIKTPEFEALVMKAPVKGNETFYRKNLELFVDRRASIYSSWYELFPRSQGKRKNKSGTFQDCIKRLPDIKKMGFDVIYLPPIHPIGITNRKGPNNSVNWDGKSPGSPWAIGSEAGGHKSVHPDLGTIDDFEAFVRAAHEMDIEIALDYAIQCSPDHPYVTEHPEWFYHLPDGSIRYAENPPKKYQDIYPINFNCEARQELWEELKSIILFWISKGVKIFRVDNPHTKPLKFWQWLIRAVQDDHPEVIFLAEAFTRPKVMKFLAKAGFTQSYTYFTWRNNKWELKQYLEELTQSDMQHYFRGNFFANTPDILTEVLQKGGKAAFRMRLVLAATLSSIYGIYSGYEFCENTPIREGSEEYLHSEKYEFKVRDWNQAGNIKDLISVVNRIRSENRALQQYRNLEFYHTDTDHILAYGKWTDDGSNIILVVVNLDPYNVHEDLLHFPAWKFGIQDWQTYQVRDLLTGDKYYWKGQHHYIRLDPFYQPAHVFLLRH